MLVSTNFLCLDASSIINTGTVKRPGYTPLITEEVLEEIRMHGIHPSSGTYVTDQKTPDYSDFTSHHDDAFVSLFTYTTGTRNFFVQRFHGQISSYTSLCGNQNHHAKVVIKETSANKQYVLCPQISEHLGDFSLVKQFLFFPEKHQLFESPKDKCLGRTLKSIINLIHQS